VSGTRGADERLVSIVDDDASVRLSTRRLIRSLGFSAEAFGSAEEFLASGQAARTACLILDVRMPGLDGLELQRRLRADGLQIPIVFLTGLASDAEERRALAAGAIAFLRKAVGRDALLRVVQNVFEEDSHV
jgi:FixJ family two-component response regulator